MRTGETGCSRQPPFPSDDIKESQLGSSIRATVDILFQTQLFQGSAKALNAETGPESHGTFGAPGDVRVFGEGEAFFVRRERPQAVQ